MMMHTPGPWAVRHDFRSGNGELCIGVSAARIGPKSGAVAWPSGVDDAQELANARLIAAAPDLLAALNSMIDLAEFWINHRQERYMSEEQYRVWIALGHESNAMIKARAAIARATGGQ